MDEDAADADVSNGVEGTKAVEKYLKVVNAKMALKVQRLFNIFPYVSA